MKWFLHGRALTLMSYAMMINYLFKMINMMCLDTRSTISSMDTDM